jgi:predicted enzyme related to lactoylglutathione lyase
LHNGVRPDIVLKIRKKIGATGQRFAEGFEPVQVGRVVVRLRVRDLEQAKRFYVGALGWKITKEAPGLLTLAGVLALSTREASRDQRFLQSTEAESMHVYIETKNLDAAHRNVRKAGTTRLSDIGYVDSRRRFTYGDPDGNLVEVLEPRP